MDREINALQNRQGAPATHAGADAQQVCELALVLDVPLLQLGRELMVEGMLVVVEVERHEVVDVNSEGQYLVPGAVRRDDLFLALEDARVMLALLEAELLEPREESALPPATGLGHAVDAATKSQRRMRYPVRAARLASTRRDEDRRAAL